MPATLSVVIPTCDRLPTLRRTIEAYREHACRAPFELLVVDDGSRDGTWPYLQSVISREPRLRALRQEHAGPARARNLAIAAASGAYLLLGGDDIRPASGLLDAHLAAHQGSSAPRFVLGRIEWDPLHPVTPVMRHVTGFGGQQFRFAYLRDGQRLGFKYFYSSNLSLRRDQVSALPEPFDPAFEGAAFEDTDLGYRLMGRRREIVYGARLLAYHDHPYGLQAFAARQYRVGRAARALFDKHPEVAPLFGTRELDEAIRAAREIRPAPRPEAIAEAERRLLEALAEVEAESHPSLERLYLGLFWYFQAKGMAEDRAPEAERPAALLLLFERALGCALRSALAGGKSPLRRRTVGDPDPLAWGADKSPLLRPARCLRWWLSTRLRELRFALRRSTRAGWPPAPR